MNIQTIKTGLLLLLISTYHGLTFTYTTLQPIALSITINPSLQVKFDVNYEAYDENGILQAYKDEYISPTVEQAQEFLHKPLQHLARGIEVKEVPVVCTIHIMGQTTGKPAVVLKSFTAVLLDKEDLEKLFAQVAQSAFNIRTGIVALYYERKSKSDNAAS